MLSYLPKQIFKDVFPDQDFQEAGNTVMGSRTKISAEYWQLVMSTDKEEVE